MDQDDDISAVVTDSETSPGPKSAKKKKKVSFIKHLPGLVSRRSSLSTSEEEIRKSKSMSFQDEERRDSSRLTRTPSQLRFENTQSSLSSPTQEEEVDLEATHSFSDEESPHKKRGSGAEASSKKKRKSQLKSIFQSQTSRKKEKEESSEHVGRELTRSTSIQRLSSYGGSQEQVTPLASNIVDLHIDGYIEANDFLIPNKKYHHRSGREDEEEEDEEKDVAPVETRISLVQELLKQNKSTHTTRLFSGTPDVRMWEYSHKGKKGIGFSVDPSTSDQYLKAQQFALGDVVGLLNHPADSSIPLWAKGYESPYTFSSDVSKVMMSKNATFTTTEMKQCIIMYPLHDHKGHACGHVSLEKEIGPLSSHEEEVPSSWSKYHLVYIPAMETGEEVSVCDTLRETDAEETAASSSKYSYDESSSSGVILNHGNFMREPFVKVIYSGTEKCVLDPSQEETVFLCLIWFESESPRKNKIEVCKIRILPERKGELFPGSVRCVFGPANAQGEGGLPLGLEVIDKTRGAMLRLRDSEHLELIAADFTQLPTVIMSAPVELVPGELPQNASEVLKDRCLLLSIASPQQSYHRQELEESFATHPSEEIIDGSITPREIQDVPNIAIVLPTQPKGYLRSVPVFSFASLKKDKQQQQTTSSSSFNHALELRLIEGRITFRPGIRFLVGQQITVCHPTSASDENHYLYDLLSPDCNKQILPSVTGFCDEPCLLHLIHNTPAGILVRTDYSLFPTIHRRVSAPPVDRDFVQNEEDAATDAVLCEDNTHVLQHFPIFAPIKGCYDAMSKLFYYCYTKGTHLIKCQKLFLGLLKLPSYSPKKLQQQDKDLPAAIGKAIHHWKHVVHFLSPLNLFHLAASPLYFSTPPPSVPKCVTICAPLSNHPVTNFGVTVEAVKSRGLTSVDTYPSETISLKRKKEFSSSLNIVRPKIPFGVVSMKKISSAASLEESLLEDEDAVTTYHIQRTGVLSNVFPFPLEIGEIYYAHPDGTVSTSETKYRLGIALTTKDLCLFS